MSSFRGQWLPGDERGFRDHGHRIHSSGDYRKRPPRDEHAQLRAHVEVLRKETISLSSSQQASLGNAILRKLEQMKVPVEALAIDAVHCHALIRVNDLDAVEVFGRAKQFASHQLRHEIPGKLWGASSHIVRIRNAAHFEQARTYILNHSARGAWTWEFER